MQRIICNITALGVLLALLNCGERKIKNEQLTSQEDTTLMDRIFVSTAQFERGKMMLGSLTEKPFPSTVEATGMIDVPPENRAVVTTAMGGYIKNTPLLIGDKVHRKQPLVTIENPEFVKLQQQYMEVNGQLTYLKAEYERQKTMRAENITSQKSFLQAESTFKTAMARHSGLHKQLQMLHILPASVEAGNISTVVTVYAPISGSVTKVNVTKGAYVSPSTAILEIIDNDHIHLELSVFEKDIMKLKKGQRINFKIPESSAETFKAEVYLISTVIEDNRTIKVHGHLKDGSDTNFLTGMFVEASIITNSVSAKALPRTAVIASGNNAFILKLVEENEKGYYFEKLPVKPQNTYDGNIALSKNKDLTGTDRILIKGAFSLITDE